MLSSLKKIMTLPDDTNVYCGHEYTLVRHIAFPCSLYEILPYIKTTLITENLP